MRVRKVMNQLTLKIVVCTVAASIAIVFAVALWPTGGSRQARPPEGQQPSETVQAEITGEGVYPVERKARAEKLDSGQLQSGQGYTLATMDPAEVLAALEAISGGDNPDVTFSSTEEVVRQLLAQRIAGGELRLPPSGTALAADPRKAPRIGPTRAALQRTTGGSALVGSAYSARQTQRSGPATAGERGLNSDARSVTNTRRRGLRPAGSVDIRLVPAKPKHIEIQPVEPKKTADIKVTDSNAPRP